MTYLKTSDSKRITQSSDWVRFDEGSNPVFSLNLNLVEEAEYRPSDVGEPELTIFFVSGRQRELKGEQAHLLWHYINQGISFKLERFKLEPLATKAK